MVAAGINYQRLMRENGWNVYDLAENLEVSVEHVKRSIEKARERKAQAQTRFACAVENPRFFIHHGSHGEKQNIKRVDIAIERSVQIKYTPEQVTEFTVMLPVKVTVTRM